jgi:phosphate transport system permease protein
MRRFEEAFFRVLMAISTLIVLGSLVLIIGTVIVKGFGSLSLDMITKTPQGGYYLGKEGGILNAIVGSLLIAGGATVVAIFFSIPVALFINVYEKRNSRLAHVTRVSLELMWGIPSIVYGAFGFTIMLFMGMKASLLAGIITVALLVFPIMCRAMDEVLSMAPKEIFDASYSLGATRFETAMKVAVRQSLPGIMSAILVAFGRGIGDAASVLFTAGFSDSIPTSLFEPAATLPLAIFFQLGTPFAEVRNRAYASAFILTVIILIISISARLLARKYEKHVVK